MNKILTDDKLINHLISRGSDEIIDKNHLEEKLRKGDKLRVKLGIDPTAKDLHLGHSVVLNKLKQFQELGHDIIFIIGDFTAAIGDPSGRDVLRPTLTTEQIKENMKNYLQGASKIIDIKKTEVRYNSEWYNNKKADFFMMILSKFTIARLLERDDFQKRLKQDVEISMLEILYPILQGYDSLEVNADVEIGGTDQKFNLLMGRKVQKKFNKPEQDIITVPLLEGLDGVKKMSKSLGNYIGITDLPAEIYGKTMSIPDSLMVKYFTLLTNKTQKEIEELKNNQLNPTLTKKLPKEWKEELAFELVEIYYNKKEAQKAQEEFNKIFSRGEKPDNMTEYHPREGRRSLKAVLSDSGMVESGSDAKRLIDQGAVDVNEKQEKDFNHQVKAGDTIKAGSRRFLKII